MTTLLNLHRHPEHRIRAHQRPRHRLMRLRDPIGRRHPSVTGQAVPSTALTRSIHEMGLMRRRYGYYWAKLIGAVLILAAWVVGFIWIGDSWWQLANAGSLRL